ncbi:UNVERIFIED_CONTAM: hypothetical protein FKN15_055973 [Acipenser sinensis]
MAPDRRMEPEVAVADIFNNAVSLESSFLVGSGGGRRNQGEVQGAWREREERNTGLEVVVGKWPEPLGGRSFGGGSRLAVVRSSGGWRLPHR